jgi:hypothetical protein
MCRRWLVSSSAVALLVLGVFLIAGCGDTVTMSEPSTVDDEETLRAFIDEDGIFDDLGPYEGGASSVWSSDARAEIDPLTFWRVITDRHRKFEILFDPAAGTAEVTVYRQIWGVLHIVDGDMVEYEKRFHHEGLRHANFARDENWDPSNGPSDHANGQQNCIRCGPWILTELSGFRAQSDTLTVAIDWIRVQSATVDVTITDPLELMSVPDEIMAFKEGEDVTVTVSGPAEGSILFLHTRHWKSPLQYESGTFAGTWTVTRAGRHTAWIEAMAHDTLFDSEYPEDTLIWGMSYVVEGEGIEE